MTCWTKGFLVRDYNAIHEVWRQDVKGMSKKKDDKERAAREAERKFINHCYNDLKHENFADAEVKLKDVVSHFPDNELVYWGMGWAKYATGNYEDALALYDEALKRNDRNWGTYVVKALCYQNLGQSRNELAMYDRVLELRGDLDYIWYNRGLAAHAMGDLAMEKQSYESATTSNANNHFAWYNLGTVLCRERQQPLRHALLLARQGNQRAPDRCGLQQRRAAGPDGPGHAGDQAFRCGDRAKPGRR